MHILFFVTEDHHDGLITSSASEICGEADICLGAKAKVECSGYIRSLTRGMCRCYQVSGNKYQHLQSSSLTISSPSSQFNLLLINSANSVNISR